MNSNLKNLTKNELLSIINKMKKNDLIKIIESKIGGGDEQIIKQSKTAIRKSIVFNKNKLNKLNKNNNVMANDPLYNNI
jgi:hypothetical protein